MYQNAVQQNAQRNTFSQPPLSDSDKINQHMCARRARNLWLHAKQHFYYRDDVAKAAQLCKRLIAQYGQTEEADDAKLLLHDIRIEIRKLTEGNGGKPLDHVQEAIVGEEETENGSLLSGVPMKISMATAIVILPIIGIAQGGVVGVILPESLALMTMGVFFWVGSKILLKGGKRRNI